MKMKFAARFGASLAVLATPVATFAQAAPAPALKAAAVADLIKRVNIPYDQFTLPNGLRVIVHTDRKAPVVAVSVWYNIGSKFEPKGKTGFAHLFEHLMFNGSENAPGDFFEPLKQVGATELNGTTSFDRTNYFETVPTPALEKTLFIESDRMGYLLGAVTQSVLDEQRGVVQNEKRQGDTRPYGLLQYEIFGGLFPASHPYGHTPIGSLKDLDAASLDDVKAWFRNNYGPNNAVLVLAGDVDLATAKTLVAKYFGPIARGPAVTLPKVDIPSLTAPKSVVLKDRVAATLLTRMWAVPGLNDKDVAGLTAAASVLGGLSSSRLNNVLVRQEKLAVQASSSVSLQSQAGLFQVIMAVRPGVDVAVASKRLDEVIAEFLKSGPTADELQRTVTSNVTGRIVGLESVGGFGGKAVALAQGALFSNDPAYYKKQLAALAAQTPAGVQAVAQKWLSRPAYAISVEAGARPPSDDVAAAPKPAGTAKDVPAKGTRGAQPAVGAIADLAFPAIERTRLSNGIELVFAQRSAVPITRALISFDAGSTADPADKLGLQQLTLSMLDEGTASRDSLALAEALERLGVNFGTGTGADRTYLSVSAPSANATGAFDLFADVVRNPAFAPAEVARLRNAQLAGIQQELTSPDGLAGRVLPALIYGAQSPYAKVAAGGGDPAAVAKLTPEDLRAFQQAWLRPDKAKIFVISDLTLAQIKPMLEAQFGDWKGVGAAGVKDFAVKPVQSASRIILVDRPDSPQSLIVGGQLTPLDGTGDLLRETVANDVLGGGFLSRINYDLRETKHWAYGAGGGFAQYENAVAYRVRASVQADKTGESIASLRTDISDFLGAKGVTEAEFTRTINGATRELAGKFETAGAVLSAMLDNDQFKRPDNYYATITQKYRALSATQLDAAARKAITPDNWVWVVVGDAKIVRTQLDSLGLPVEVITPAAIVAAKK